jgi:hypothetical protein
MEKATQAAVRRRRGLARLGRLLACDRMRYRHSPHVTPRLRAADLELHVSA